LFDFDALNIIIFFGKTKYFRRFFQNS
jgi:hypothetical protein